MLKISMKLWQKYLLSLGAVGTTAGAIVGAVYAYSQSDSSQGPKHYSPETLKINLEKMQEISSYDMSFRDPVNTKLKLGNYNFVSENDPGNINGQNANDFINNYYKTHGQPPVMTILAGGIKFNNFYTDAILPIDFVEFVNWFSKNISWTPGISSINAFTLKKGIEDENGVATLGGYTNVNGEKKEIKFLPDSFFDQISINNLIYPFMKGLTKEEVFSLANHTTRSNKMATDDWEKIFLYSAEKRKDGLYNVFATRSGIDSIIGMNKMYSDKRNVGDIDLTTNNLGEVSCSLGNSSRVLYDSKISRLTLLRSFSSNWKGIGTNFLKYVTTHEYGHMQTLSMSMDATTNPVALEPSSNTRPNIGMPDSALNIDVLNNYLKARIPYLHAIRVSPVLVQDTNGKWVYNTYADAMKNAKDNGLPMPSPHDYTNIAFEYSADPKNLSSFSRLELDKIFGDVPSNIGKIVDPTSPDSILYPHDAKDPNFKKFLDQMLKQIKNSITANQGTKVQFLMRDVTDLRAFAKFLGVPEYAVMFMNANDNLLATTSPKIESDGTKVPFGKQLNNNNEWVEDNAFNILVKGTTNKWFVDSNPSSGVPLPSITSIETGKHYWVTLDGYKNIWNDQNIAPFTNAVAWAGYFQDQQKLKDLTSFFVWFKNTLLEQGKYSIWGNEVMHSQKFHVEDLVEHPFSSLFWYGTKNANDISAFWNALNNPDATKADTKYSFKYEYKSGASEEVHGIYDFDFSDWPLFLTQMTNYAPHLSASIIAPTEAVANVKVDASNSLRIVSTITEGLKAREQGYDKMSTFGKNLGALLMPIFKDDRLPHMAGQKLFDFSQSGDSHEFPFIAYGATNRIKYAFDINNEALTLNTAQTLAKQYNMAIPTTYREALDFINLIYLSEIKTFTINPNFEFQYSKQNNPINFNGANVKRVPISKLPELLSLDTENLSIEKNKNIQGNLNLKYIANANDANLLFTSPTQSLIDAYSYYSSNSLIFGIRDTAMNSQGVVNLIKKELEFGPSYSSDFIQNVFGQKIFDIAGKTLSTFDETKAKKYLDQISLEAMDKMVTKPKRLFSWSKILLSSLSFDVLTSKEVRAFDDLSYFKIYDTDESPMKQWIANPHDGFASTLAQAFSTYTSKFAEVLTRDWIQMTFSPNGDVNSQEDKFRFQNKYSDLTEKNTGFDLYFDPKSVLDQSSHLYKLSTFHYSDDDLSKDLKNKYGVGVVRQFGHLLWTFLFKGLDADNNPIKAEFDKTDKSLVYKLIKKIIDTNYSDEQAGAALGLFQNNWDKYAESIATSIGINIVNELADDTFSSLDGNNGIFNEYFINNGYYKDRWLREQFNNPSSLDPKEDWKLYDDSGHPVHDDNILLHSARYDKNTHSIGDSVISNRPEAYWWWLIKSYGAGDRSVSSIYKVYERDALSMWGILPEDLADRVKYIKAISQETGEIKYINVHTENTNNLFYLTKQADLTSKHKLIDDGYKTWVTDLQVFGTWRDATLSNGHWELKFVDKNYKDVQWVVGNHNAFTLGTKGIISEDNKDKSYAPIIMEEKNNKVIMTIRNQFAN